MRLVTWNLNFRRNVAAQLEAVTAADPDVVVFQEVRKAGFEEMAEQLASAGLPHFTHSLEHCDEGYTPALGRFVAVGSRWRLRAAASVGSDAPEAVVSVEVAGPVGAFELVGLYVPTASRDDHLKVPTQEAVALRMRRAIDAPHVLCGDFNSPKAEAADGTITPFSRKKNQRAVAAELGLLNGLAAFGMVDAFRACNGFEADDSSWYWKNRGRMGGYRLDHIMASRHFEVRDCFYNHEVRLSGLSDHSMMVADLEFR